MLSLLLDEHISPAVAEQARRKSPGLQVIALRDWRDGKFLGSPDATILSEAFADRLTFVTYDQRTIPPLLKSWIEQGVDFGGVVFVDEKTIAPQDFGGLVSALGSLWRVEKHADWKNRVVFLRRVL
jgi:hypothetical protein